MGTEIEFIAYTNSMRTMKKSYTRFLDIEARKHIRACVNVLWYIFYKKKKNLHAFRNRRQERQVQEKEEHRNKKRQDSSVSTIGKWIISSKMCSII